MKVINAILSVIWVLMGLLIANCIIYSTVQRSYTGTLCSLICFVYYSIETMGWNEKR